MKIKTIITLISLSLASFAYAGGSACCSSQSDKQEAPKKECSACKDGKKCDGCKAKEDAAKKKEGDKK
jgi:hypothetical protein